MCIAKFPRHDHVMPPRRNRIGAFIIVAIIVAAVIGIGIQIGIKFQAPMDLALMTPVSDGFVFTPFGTVTTEATERGTDASFAPTSPGLTVADPRDGFCASLLPVVSYGTNMLVECGRHTAQATFGRASLLRGVASHFEARLFGLLADSLRNNLRQSRAFGPADVTEDHVAFRAPCMA